MNNHPWQLAIHVGDDDAITSAAHTTSSGDVETLRGPEDPHAAIASAIERHGRPPTELIIVYDGAPPEQLSALVASELAIPVGLMPASEALTHYRSRTGNGGPAEGHPIITFAGGSRDDASRVPALGALVAGPGAVGVPPQPGAAPPPREATAHPQGADATSSTMWGGPTRGGSSIGVDLPRRGTLLAIASAVLIAVVALLLYVETRGPGEDAPADGSGEPAPWQTSQEDAPQDPARQDPASRQPAQGDAPQKDAPQDTAPRQPAQGDAPKDPATQETGSSGDKTDKSSGAMPGDPGSGQP